jgi:hypothetical protein
MKQRPQLIALAIFAFLVVVVAIQFFTFSRQTNIAPLSGGTHEKAGPATEIIKYIPPAPLATIPVEEGSCWTSSIAAPYRTDAWRCTVGNSISDPCFAIPGNKNLLCGAVPAKPKSISAFVLKLTQPLPGGSIVQGPVPNDWAWLLKLQDGTLCSPFTGTRPFTQEGESANYGCAPGPLGNDLFIFGDFNTSTPQWTARVGILSIPTSTLPSAKNIKNVPIATIWQ